MPESSLFGILAPFLFALISSIIGFILGLFKRSIASQHALAQGLQALLRQQILTMYKEAKEAGFTTSYERDSFENLYVQYHLLGANGVIDDIREKYLDMEIKE